MKKYQDHYNYLSQFQNNYLIEKEKMKPKKIYISDISNADKVKLRQAEKIISLGKDRKKWKNYYIYLRHTYGKNWQKDVAKRVKMIYCNHNKSNQNII